LAHGMQHIVQVGAAPVGSVATGEIVMPYLLGFMCALVAIASALFVPACNDTQIFEYADEGELCLNSKPDGTLHAAVRFPTCLSSTCDRVLSTSCTIVTSGNEISISSSGAFESPQYGSCSADCAPLIAECTSQEQLTPGDYTLVHGESRGELTIPASGTALFSTQGLFSCEPL